MAGKKMKKFTLQVIAGANVATILMMLMTGYSDRIDPVSHPVLACGGMAFCIFLFFNLLFLFFWLIFRVREAIIPVIGFLLCFGPVRRYTPFNWPLDIPKDNIKVLSYNVEQYGLFPPRPDTASTNPVIRYIASSKADLVCLQEANGLDADSANAIFSRIYPYSYYETKSGSGDRIVIYSKFPMSHKRIIPYPSKGNMSISCVLNIKGREVLVVNNHFESNKLDPEDKADFKNLVKGGIVAKGGPEKSDRLIDKLSSAAAIRALQVDSVCRFISEQRKGRSVIVCGDFNDNPISYSLYQISKDLVNCYVATGNGPGLSYHRSGMLFRIDHILCSSDWRPYQAKVDRRIKESDHYPIYCWLSLKGTFQGQSDENKGLKATKH